MASLLISWKCRKLKFCVEATSWFYEKLTIVCKTRIKSMIEKKKSNNRIEVWITSPQHSFQNPCPELLFTFLFLFIQGQVINTSIFNNNTNFKFLNLLSLSSFSSSLQFLVRVRVEAQPSLLNKAMIIITFWSSLTVIVSVIIQLHVFSPISASSLSHTSILSLLCHGEWQARKGYLFYCYSCFLDKESFSSAIVF